ncbi:MAG: hypothetical protein K0S53_2589 [Bacteroidetes bacterium]|jgi:hypothetical protein|nr:hypothetical protein [Bacteroidota bacterium]MDF2450973.1 hypothetical protein [Bacteroidota bacterium]
MKKTIAGLLFLAISNIAFSQAQPQGEFHKSIIKKTEEIRKKTKPQEWWNKGVIVFSKQEIKRLGTVAETQKNITSTFKADDTFYGRAFMPKSIGQLERKPSGIITRFYIDGKLSNFELLYSGENMLDDAWSSWSYIFPEDFPKMYDDLTTGEHTFKMEIWTDVPTEKTTTYVDENDKTVGTTKEQINRGQFLGAGEFKVIK